MKRLTLAADIDYLGDISRSGFETGEAEIRLESDLCKELPAFRVGENKGNVVQQAKPDSEGIGAMNICQDPWPFDWTTVDIPGSPGLSRLFKAWKLKPFMFQLSLWMGPSRKTLLVCPRWKYERFSTVVRP